MSRRAYLALSAAATAFVLVLIGGVSTYVMRSHSASSPQASASVPVEVVNAREAEYRRLIEEANARLRARRAMPGDRSPAGREKDEGPSHEASRGGHEYREDDDG